MLSFEYVGKRQSVPKDVIRVKFHPPDVIEVDMNAFYDCQDLREVVLNNGLKQIRDNAFYNCHSLESITLPSTLTEINKRLHHSLLIIRLCSIIVWNID